MENICNNITVAVDIVIFTIDQKTLRILLVERSGPPFKGNLALPGGFLHEGETAKDAVQRIIKEKAGLENVYYEQLYTFDDRDRDPRGQVMSIAHFAVTAFSEIEKKFGSIENASFLPVNYLPKLAFDHTKIVKYALERLRFKFEYTNIAYSMLPEEFTLTNLQQVYEIVLSEAQDKRNFRKKYLELDLIEETGKMSKASSQRPAQLWRFKKRELVLLKKPF